MMTARMLRKAFRPHFVWADAGAMKCCPKAEQVEHLALVLYVGLAQRLAIPVCVIAEFLDLTEDEFDAYDELYDKWAEMIRRREEGRKRLHPAKLLYRVRLKKGLIENYLRVNYGLRV